MKRSVFFISDRTGITAEMLGHGLLTQFENVEFQKHNLPFIDNTEKAEQAVARINQANVDDGNKPILFSTLLDEKLRAIIATSDALYIDFFDAFIGSLETELDIKATRAVGRSHGMDVYANYKERIDAVNFALNNDDGISHINYSDADIILIGVSRTGKTPTCLYLALQYGLKVANYPLTEEDMRPPCLPELLRPYKNKLFGLTINPTRLQQIRFERLAKGRYASQEQCEFEVKAAIKIFQRDQIAYLDSSLVSIEEMATSIMHQSGLDRHLHG